jgi:hypothetical protein
MTFAHLALALALAVAPAAEANEPAQPAPPLKLRSKAAMAEVLSARPSPAPFRAPVLEPELELLPQPADPRLEGKRWSCTGESSLCYDPDSRRIVYKPARALMPDIPGLRRENISVKRDRITFKYSF